MRQLTYTNGLGASIALDTPPYLITSLTGIDQAPVLLQAQKAPYQDGESYIDSPLDIRTISVQGAITPAPMSVLWSRRLALVQALNPKAGMGTLVLKTEAGSKLINCIPNGPHFLNKNGNDPFFQYSIDFDCLDPYWYSVTQGLLKSTATIGLTNFPFNFPLALGISTGGIGAQVTSNGDVQTPVTITITGPCVNPKILNVTTGFYIRIIKTLVAGDVMTINTAFGKKSVLYTPAGSGQISGMQYLDLNSTFWQLQPGANTIKFSDDSGSLTALCSMTWFDRFLGV